MPWILPETTQWLLYQTLSHLHLRQSLVTAQAEWNHANFLGCADGHARNQVLRACENPQVWLTGCGLRACLA